MNDLFKKQIDLKSQSGIFGGSWNNSGGTESGNTGMGTDTYLTVFNDDCGVYSQSVFFNQQ